MSGAHILERVDEDEDRDGWWRSECSCGWISLPAPSAGTAEQMFDEHDELGQ